MNMSLTPTSKLRLKCLNYPFYENVLLSTILIIKNNSHMVFVQYTFTYSKTFHIKSHFHSLRLAINV